ncbi:O-antigen ligase family protein [Pontibacter rufus]|uniref:O-antigen ligase family protein n=1 Tax=Pontibacter rufus TaxID=2791028 RepID=UPI0018AFD698|nr:O-antigen ligase family protein [Pontibacter sp. 172403-2]
MLLWLAFGVVLRYGALPLIFLHLVFLFNKGKIVYCFIGFIFIIILSDSRHPELRFAQDLKTLVVVLFALALMKGKVGTFSFKTYIKWYVYFLPFILVALLCIIYSPAALSAFQKTISYLLLIVIGPTTFYALYETYGEKFLRTFVLSGVAVFVAGFVLYMINPTIVMYNYGGRSSGALGNPNGLGIFCFLFYILYYIVQHYFPHLFSKREHLLIPVLIIASLLWSGSRGQTLSLLIFVVTQFLSRRNKAAGLILSAAIGIMLILIDIDIVAIASTFGFEDYLRVDSLEAGGGRVVARAFAWEQIQKSPWVGNGFNYTEYIYHQHFYELSRLGHEGNAHNTFLTVWLDTGLIGLFLFVAGWGVLFWKAANRSYLAIPIVFAVIASNMVESWLIGSLNPYTILLLIMLTLLIYIVKDAPAVAIARPDRNKRVPAMPEPLHS